MWRVTGKRFVTILGSVMLVATACGGGAAAPSPSASVAASPTAETMTQPTKPIEFVISTAPGGGSDIYARAMAGIIEKNKLSPQPVQPVNKEGGSATVAAALAGHQGGVNATVNNPSEGLPFYQGTNKKLRPLCAFTPESPKTGVYTGLATCASQGIPIDDYYIMRAIVAAPGLTPAQQAFWVDVFKKVYDSAEWKKFMDDNALNPDFRTGIDFRQFLTRYQQVHQDIATKFNWVQ